MDASQAIAIRNRIIGILVKRARLKAGKSQRECAEFLGCSPFMFGQYEVGQRGMSLPQLEALAHLFHLPLSSLWDETDVLDSEEPAEPLPIAQLMLLRRKVLAIQLRQCRNTAGLTQQELAELLGRSAYIVSQYEQGKRDVPLAELEIIAEQGNQGLADFMDEQAMPLGQDDQDRQALVQLRELDPQVREFVLKPTNALYMRIAMLLSSLKADSLRQIAETILDITY
jgi:transcriptional regulator with XRE-family HTH domain